MRNKRRRQVDVLSIGVPMLECGNMLQVLKKGLGSTQKLCTENSLLKILYLIFNSNPKINLYYISVHIYTGTPVN